jgi:predicted transcriptional regulator
MRRSKIEMYVDILEVLAHNGPLKLTHIMYGVNVNCSLLKEHVEFLTKQGLIEEKTLEKERTAYAITQLGLKILQQFKALKEVLPIIEKTEQETKNQEPYIY